MTVTPSDAECKEVEDLANEMPDDGDLAESCEHPEAFDAGEPLPIEDETVLFLLRGFARDTTVGLKATAVELGKELCIKTTLTRGVYTGSLVLAWIARLAEHNEIVQEGCVRHGGATGLGVMMVMRRSLVPTEEANVCVFAETAGYRLARKRVVVLGGGFGGVEVCKKLAKKYDLVLVTPTTYFQNHPSLPIVTCVPDHLDKVRETLTNFLPRQVQYVYGKCTALTRHAIGSEIPVGCPRELSLVHTDAGVILFFDYLFICTGSRYIMPISASPGSASVIDPMDGDQIRAAHATLKEAQNVVVIGGGPTGIEVAGEIMWHCDDKALTIISGHNRSMHRAAPTAHRNIESYIERFSNAVMMVGDRVDRLEGHELLMQNGDRVPCDIVYCAVGFTPNTEFLHDAYPECVDERGYVVVNEHLQMNGTENVFAIGDVAGVVEEKLAQNALKHSLVTVSNLYVLEKSIGKEGSAKLKAYAPGKRFVVVSLGPKNALMIHGDKVWLEGKLISKLKTLVEFKTMIGLSIPITLSV